MLYLSELMSVFCDCHLHIYPRFDLVSSVSAIAELARTRVDAQYCFCLAETIECSFFESVRSGHIKLPGVEKVYCVEREAIELDFGDRRGVFIFAGRQIVTREGLEFLVLCSEQTAPLEPTFEEIITFAKQAGALLVLNWAPGKWWFRRGKIIGEMLESYTPENFFLGDTSLRPPLWSEPLLMKRAKQRGFITLAGSDPLPRPGEEEVIATYGVVLPDAQIDTTAPASSFKEICRGLTQSPKTFGKRSGNIKAACRVTTQILAKRMGRV